MSQPQTSVTLPARLRLRLQRYAKTHGLSVSMVIRTAVEKFLGAK